MAQRRFYCGCLHVERGGDGTVVAVIDARTEEAKKVEHKMTGYENDEKKRDILPVIKDKLICLLNM